MIQECNAIRDQFFQTPIPELKEKFKDKNEDWLSEFYFSIFDRAWRQKLESDQLTTLGYRVFEVLPANACPNMVCNLSILTLLEKYSKPFNVTIDVQAYEKKLNPGLCEVFQKPDIFDNCPKAQFMLQLKEAFEKKDREKIPSLLKEAPLDHYTPPHGHLIDLVLGYGTCEDLEIVLQRYHQKIGSQNLTEVLLETPYIFRIFIQGNETDLKKLIEILRKVEIDPFVLFYANGTEKSVIYECWKLEQLKIYLSVFSPEQVKSVLNTFGGIILQNFMSCETLENFKKTITLFEELGADLSVIFRSRVRHSQATIIDRACMDGHKKHLKFLFEKMTEKDKSELLFISGHGTIWFGNCYEVHCASLCHQLYVNEQLRFQLNI
jgi:hypothetical protein